MKTKFFRKNEIVKTWRAASLLAALLCPIVLTAQNGVTVSNLAVNAGTVTFNVHWDKNAMPVALWSDTVWVFVDYNNNGTMERLPLLPGATLTATSPGGKVIEISGNNKGVWVVGNARTNGSFSATVKLLYDAATSVAGACAYASNYPPVGKYISGIELSFTGTPPYEIVLKDSNSGTITRESGSPFSVPASYTVQSFSDKTGAPGTFLCIPPAAPTMAKGEFCYEQSGELVASASSSVTIEWYNAITGGTFLHAGEVLSLPPLYNASAQYYAQAVSDGNCRSVRVKAEYTVSNCEMSGDCPNYTAGSIAAPTMPAACAAHYAGQIGSSSPSCVAHDAGRIDRSQ
jgi:hypothetical protein